MKNNTKRSFEKFNKRNTHKRKSKDKARAELLRLVEKTNVNFDGVKISDVTDGGRGSRVSTRARGDETVISGVFSSAKGGFGFVCRESGDDVFIPHDKRHGAIDGDLVEAVYHEYRDSYGEYKTEGRITKVLEFGRRTVTGVLHKERYGFRKKTTEVYIIEPDDAKLGSSMRVSDIGDAVRGDKVLCRLVRCGEFVECKVIESFGPSYTFGANYMSALAEFEIETEFSPEAQREARSVASTVITPEGREDLRDEVIFTIDGAGAKDLDDAISLRRLPNGYKLGVHIADVAEYVKEKTPLDRTAMARGTSVYFTDKVVPMLPPEISNGCCSLNANEDKYAISAIIKLDSCGNIVSSEIKPTVIRSCIRGVYSEVNAIFDGNASDEILKKYKRVIPHLEKMHELYKILSLRQSSRGMLNLEGSEAEIILGEDGMPTDIIRRERADAEKMIEAFMLTANEAVATKLHESGIPCVYRTHEPPPDEKLEGLINLFSNLSLDTRGLVDKSGRVSLTVLSSILAAAKERGIESQVSYSILRAMSKAKYSEVSTGHFGLGIELYCHFTSPIRRLSDLATHRIIKRVLFEGKSPAPYHSYAKRAAAAASEAELRALGAERRIDEMYKALYLSSHIGEVFPAVVSSVTPFGLFLELENTCEGLVPLSELGGSYAYDEKNLSIRFGGKSYRLGDGATVRVEECDALRGKIRFSLVL